MSPAQDQTAAAPHAHPATRFIVYFGWALGSFTTSVLVNSVGLLHMRFMTDSLGIAAAVAGTLVAISKIYDAVTDPIIGAISDRTRTRWGRRRPYFIVGTIACAITMILLFNVPRFESQTTLVVYMGLMLLLYSSAYSTFRMPYLSLAPEITTAFDERSKLMAYSVYGSSVGSLFATTLAPLMLAWWGSTRDGHGTIAYGLAMLILMGGLGCFAATKSIPLINLPATQIKVDWRSRWRAMTENRPFVVLISFKIVMFIAITMHGVAVPYFSRHAIKMTDTWLGSVYLARTVTMILSQPVWAALARRYGRRNMLMLAGVTEIICMMSWVFVTPENANLMIIPIGFLQGLSSGGIFFGLYTTLPDTMEYDYHRTGLRREGVFAGIFVMVEKISAALATSLFGITIGLLGYLESTDAGAATQPETAIQGIYLALAVVPAILAMIGCFILKFYHLTEEDLQTARKSNP